MFHYFQNFSPEAQHFDDFCYSEIPNACLMSCISDYDLGGEGDLFKAPEPIIEPTQFTLDHMTSAMSMTLSGEDLVSQDIELLQNHDFMINPYGYEDSFAEETLSPSQIMNFSVSSDSLTSVDGDQSMPGSMNFFENELEKVHGMPMAFSEGGIKPQIISDHSSETRMQKLSRYRDKKTRRNFRRKIKYACRKALADSQPRIRGRFAKIEETEV